MSFESDMLKMSKIEGKPNYITCNIKGDKCIRPTHKHDIEPADTALDKREHCAKCGGTGYIDHPMTGPMTKCDKCNEGE